MLTKLETILFNEAVRLSTALDVCADYIEGFLESGDASYLPQEAETVRWIANGSREALGCLLKERRERYV